MPYSALLPGILLPFAGTMLGVIPFLFSDHYSLEKERYLTAAAAGVMLAASIWSLLQPAIRLCKGPLSFLPPAVGFLFGVLFIAALEDILRRNKQRKRQSLLMLAVTLHNFPEGMAVGVALSGLIHSNALTAAEAAIMSLGIAIQNIPEGAIIYAPLRARGDSRRKAFLLTLLSGIVEPVGAVLTLLLTSLFTPLLPFILSFAAGAMIFVVADDMIPAAKAGKENAKPTLVFSAGFALMMILDIALG